MKIVLAFLSLCVLMPSIAFAASPVGTVVAIEGAANRRPLSGGTIIPLKENDKVIMHDTIETEVGAKLLILLNDNTEITLGEDASLAIDQYIYTPQSPQNNRGRFHAIKGAFLFVSGLIAKTDSPDVKIHTPSGSIGLRGTTVWGGKLDDQYRVLVLDGAVDFANRNGKVALSKGEGAFVQNSESGPVTGGWTDDLTSRAVATITMEDAEAIQEKLKTLKEQNTPQ